MTIHGLEAGLIQQLLARVRPELREHGASGSAVDGAGAIDDGVLDWAASPSVSEGDAAADSVVNSTGEAGARDTADPRGSQNECAQVFAGAAWSTLAEPGDAVAGLVVLQLGADRALGLLRSMVGPEDWLTRLGPTVGGSLSVSDMAAALDRWRPRLSSRAVLSALRSAAELGARLVLPCDDDWPEGFTALGVHQPMALWVRGTAGLVQEESVAVVGSRDATNYGEHVASEIAAGLSDRGVAVVSGAAYGIDGMAHRATLASGGRTVAFLAGGVDRLYPAAHSELLGRIIAEGSVVSELPCGSSPTKWRFLQRNRLIAALADATVVVEAGQRSGSLNTAGHAAALGRPLGAVPGPITSPTSAGCHRLLREFDAVCVTSAGEVIELIRGPADPASPSVDPRLRGPDGTRLLDALSRRAARGSTELARLTGLAPGVVRSALGLLLAEGAARETPAGWLRT
ncbi:DNA-processing protein DprA [Herbiconiux moechotypicola]|uniref:DNA-processing protein DprA n=1 Tax=Herbiconiux moechotypicola TaxID=637393 RepID=A0ABP5QCW5_9MICO|nr:DNA-processing protein DprA [Herbiconiux moechotypicola]MCS5729748.1 DNA-processing protein DprA [Herbiconiux moechotypicola]